MNRIFTLKSGLLAATAVAVALSATSASAAEPKKKHHAKAKPAAAAPAKPKKAKPAKMAAAKPVTVSDLQAQIAALSAQVEALKAATADNTANVVAAKKASDAAVVQAKAAIQPGKKVGEFTFGLGDGKATVKIGGQADMTYEYRNRRRITLTVCGESRS